MAARRCRIEWPTMDLGMRQVLQDIERPDDPICQPARDVIDNEVAMCDTRCGFPTDLVVHDELYVKATNWRALLHNLYWRARRQSAIWDVYELLVLRGSIQPKSLAVPIYLMSSSPDTGLDYCFTALMLLVC